MNKNEHETIVKITIPVEKKLIYLLISKKRLAMIIITSFHRTITFSLFF